MGGGMGRSGGSGGKEFQREVVLPLYDKDLWPKMGRLERAKRGAAVGLLKIPRGKDIDTGRGRGVVQRVCIPAPQNACTAITLISCPRKIRQIRELEMSVQRGAPSMLF